MRFYPALDVENADGELLLAAVDDCSPTALDEHDGTHTIFFSDSHARDRASDAIRRAFPAARVRSREVDDEDWARRSQANLAPVTVGRITIVPGRELPTDPLPTDPLPTDPLHTDPLHTDPLHTDPLSTDPSLIPNPKSLIPAEITLLIPPSMGFGTGHHATTRLCLEALQIMTLEGASMLDVGTGSGVLALAARALGAGRVLGIDNDPDAVECANGNLALNEGPDIVRFELRDVDGLEAGARRKFDVLTANLTGTLLCRTAPALASMLAARGRLIVSGLLCKEYRDVSAAFQPLRVAWRRSEDGWDGLVFENAKNL